MDPVQVIEEIKKSGLHGRGGGGFPTGIKWETCSRHEGDRYDICNADEGDPGAYMDRSLYGRIQIDACHASTTFP